MSLWDNKDQEKWETTVPADLNPAIKYLRDSFCEAHTNFGVVINRLAFAQLHSCLDRSKHQPYIDSLLTLKAYVPLEAREKFNKLILQNTLPSIFAAYLGFYLDGLGAQGRLIFDEFLKIGRANSGRLTVDYIDWAIAQMKRLIRSERHVIVIWVRNACDTQPYDPNEDMDEQIFWTKWQAPLFVIMRPSRFHPYDRSRVWERQNCETSSQWLESIANYYVIRLEHSITHAAGLERLERAKRPEYTPPMGNSSSKKANGQPEEVTQRAAKRDTLLKRIETALPGTTLTYNETAAVFDVTPRTIQNWITEGKLAQGAKRGRVTIESIRQCM